MKKIIFYLLSVAIMTWMACKPKADISAENSATPDAGHNAQNALDWAGTYAGTLPCADCEAIRMVVILNEDLSYTYRCQYAGKNDMPTIEKTGTFSWDKGGQIVTLEGVDPPNQFFVAENRIIQLDINGERITGNLADLYELSKR
jgi:uncharacterized lipoprotein NlpE involved in copper resistance